MQRALMVFILSMITLVAMFSLVSGLVMLSADRKEEIAVLRTMGMRRQGITRIFVIQGTIITGIGVLMGVILAIILCYFAQDIANILEYLLGFQLVDERVYGTTKLPTDLDSLLVFWVSVSSLILGLIASSYPARRAAKIDPAVVLRYA
jgi:lipoprotein-releasing system permease protein